MDRERLLIAKRARVASVVALCVIAGCGVPKPPPPVSVAGKVLKQGKPLATVVVRFWPEDPQLQERIKPATATTGEDGQFHCKTPPGRYKVTLFAPPQANLDPQIESGAPKSPVPRKPTAASIPSGYQSAESTPLSVEVPPGGKEDLVLAVN
jgi:ubiquitin